VSQTTTPQAQIADHIAVFQRLLQQGFDQLIMLRHRSLFPNFTKSGQCNSKRCQSNHNDARGNAAKFKIAIFDLASPPDIRQVFQPKFPKSSFIIEIIRYPDDLAPTADALAPV
jgi:hypothetical protein